MGADAPDLLGVGAVGKPDLREHRIAVHEERASIARELHEGAGHHGMSAIIGLTGRKP